ncbi:Hermansky-Pudlak syndrome 4 protein isoform X2 [Calliopsis andreniformis]|uniref:Hermansky-Pudlak syndrome 4 protein isoform X2 n=1 Tax=Calliopsis andreniformis TaxID=337506 RepID=UPI003FCD4598
MAKEMMIVFVYDTARCCKEDDDPAEAVMYFHPAWVSLTQRLALAGQLMAVNQFLTTSFSAPKSIALQGGKFVLKKFGQYILAVGTDRNIHDWILERRANTLESLLKFFHCDLNKILESFNNDRNKFTEKLYQMFETYLPILQYSANLFSNIPIIKLPKSASNIFLEAIQVLQYCQETNGILGGALFYNNKVVATQLSANLTKQIVITDPYRIKAPAERIPTEFHLPVGVQLLRVYIEQKQFAKLMQEAKSERYYSSYLDSVTKKTLQRKNMSKNNKEPPLSAMKRDTSRIFTVPEEGELDSSQYNDNSHYVPSVPLTAYSSPVKRKQETKTDRPKCANPLTPSVCSTPLKDINRVLHGNAMLICNADEEANVEAEEKKKEIKTNVDDIPDVVKEALRCKRLNKLKNVLPNKKLDKRKESNRKSLSMHDLDSSTNFYSNRISVRTYGLGLPQLKDRISPESSPQKKPAHKKQFQTITDPCYPVFRCDGLPVSKSLYDQYISTHYEELQDDSSNTINRNNFLASLTNSCNAKNAKNNCDTTSKDNIEKPNNSRDLKLDSKTKQETYRRSMSLPLKPLNVTDNDDRRKSASECGNTYDFLQKKKLDGLQLTPLMSKLSLLADERTSGFCSRETTPSEFRDLSGFSTATNQMIKQKLEAANKEMGSDGEDELEEDWVTTSKDEVSLEKTELFLCGHQNMVLVLLMENGTANNPDLIHSLWQTCVTTLGKLETRLQQCLEPLPSNENKELYSILSIDPQWDTINRSGLWGVTELDIVSSLHDRFTHASNLTDIIVRDELPIGKYQAIVYL